MTLVRGYLDCPYHADILAKFKDEELLAQGDEVASTWQAECPGGGRIQVNEASK